MSGSTRTLLLGLGEEVGIQSVVGIQTGRALYMEIWVQKGRWSQRAAHYTTKQQYLLPLNEYFQIKD